MKHRLKYICGLFVVMISTLNSFAENVEIHGSVSQSAVISTSNEYLFSGTKEGSLQFTEFLLNFNQRVNDDLKVGAQLLSRNFGGHGTFKTELDWAFGDYRLLPWLGVKAGRMKMPVGLYNEIRDVDIAREMLLLPQSVYPEGFRDIFSAYNGLGLYGFLGNQEASFGELGFDFYFGQINSGEMYFVKSFVEQFNANYHTQLENYRFGGSTLEWWPGFLDTRVAMTINYFLGFVDLKSTDLRVQTPAGPIYVGEYPQVDEAMRFEGRHYQGGLEFMPTEKIKIASEIKIEDTQFEFSDAFVNQLSQKLNTSPEYRALIMEELDRRLAASPIPLTRTPLLENYAMEVATNPDTLRSAILFNLNDYARYSGWYIMASYLLTDQLTFYVGYEQSGFSKSVLESLTETDLNFITRNALAGSSFSINEYWKIKGEVHRIEGRGASHVESAIQTEDVGYLYLARTTFAF
jgi:hypothetical protein